MKTKYIRAISSICAAVILIAALSVSAFAATSIEEEMAANSAAWWVAYNAGDTATCEALHAANVALAAQAVESVLFEGLTPSLSAANLNSTVVGNCKIYWQSAADSKTAVKEYIDAIRALDAKAANAITDDFFAI